MRQIDLRPACHADIEFAYEVTEAAMRDYVEQTWGRWEPNFQRKNHEFSFEPETHEVIVVDQVAVGIVATETHETHIQLTKLYLLPSFQNKGVGSHVLTHVCNAAADIGKPIRLRILAVSKAAQRFYAHHGFVVTRKTPERVFMESQV